MFSKSDLPLLNLSYFQQVFIASDVCELISQNGDHWIIMMKQVSVPKAQVKYKQGGYIYELYHRHAHSKGFHLHAEYTSVLDSILDIINHDDYRLKRKGKTYFDEVVATYSYYKNEEGR